MKKRKTNLLVLKKNIRLYVILSALINNSSYGQITETAQQINGPGNISETASWLKQIEEWKKIEKAKLAYSNTFYKDKEIQWVRSSFIQTQMMAQERSFYDPVKNEYTVDKYLDEIASRYGGLNSILVWPTYPNIGVDNRNQFDWIRCLPRGLDGVRDMVKQFHKHGIKVLLPYNPWDIGTRREPESDVETFAKILKYVDADGINGDVTSGLGANWRSVFDKAKKGIAIEPELDYDDKYTEYDQMGWAYWEYPFIPSISKRKWIEHSHMVHVCDRWAHDHTSNLQFAFFNGAGFETWENIWTVYNEMTLRTVQTVKIMSSIYQKYYDLLTGENWLPHYPMLNYGIFASKWYDENRELWTIVNRNDYTVNGQQMKVPYKDDITYYDVWHGCILKPVKKDNEVIISFSIERNGFASILAIKNSMVNNELESYLKQMSDMTKTDLSQYSNTWQPVKQQIVEIKNTTPAAIVPEGMIKIPGIKYNMNVSGIEIEGGENPGVDVQMPGEEVPHRHHYYEVDINAFYMDEYPVTNKQFKEFMNAVNYKPVDTINFLKDWKKGSYPEGWEQKPVTWVDIEDARAYAKWAGKRLPNEWEWQYAAQGTDGRLYPWGNDWNSSAVPLPDTGNELRGPDNVDSHPNGKSPFGIGDMVGNVWQWTNEYVDDHSRAAIVRGGSYYKPQGSYWYFPQAYKLNEHGKYLLMSPGQNRAGTIGFRCVKDVVQ